MLFRKALFSNIFLTIEIIIVDCYDEIHIFNLHYLSVNNQRKLSVNTMERKAIVPSANRVVMDLHQKTFIDGGAIINYNNSLSVSIRGICDDSEQCEFLNLIARNKISFSCNSICRYITFEGTMIQFSVEIRGYYLYAERYIGCYVNDESSVERLNKEMCMNYCPLNGPVFFALQEIGSVVHCYCMNSISMLEKLDLDYCYHSCSSAPGKICGGSGKHVSIYSLAPLWGMELQFPCFFESIDCPSCPPGRSGYYCERIECKKNNGNCGTGKCDSSLALKIATCSCETGFKFTYETNSFDCTDFDECALQPCDRNSRSCNNIEGSYECLCKVGFKNEGRTKCIDIDECSIPSKSEQCDSDTTYCINEVGHFRCECKPGFYGLILEEILQLCYDTDECQSQKDNCDKATTRCKNNPGSYSCECISGFTLLSGSQCLDIDECQNKPCDVTTSHCKNNVGSYYCECIRGYKRIDLLTCGDTDECEQSHPCDVVSTYCWNQPGSFECNCRDGFERENSLKCKDIDECILLIHNCGKQSLCTNVVGSYSCQCPPGSLSFEFKYAMECEDIDECKEENKCDKSLSICLNMIMGYICQCYPGYINTDNFSCARDTRTKPTTKVIVEYDDGDYTTTDQSVIDDDLESKSALDYLVLLPLSFFIIIGIITFCLSSMKKNESSGSTISTVTNLGRLSKASQV